MNKSQRKKQRTVTKDSLGSKNQRREEVTLFPSFVLEDTEGRKLSEKAVKFFSLVKDAIAPSVLSLSFDKKPTWKVSTTNEKIPSFIIKAHPSYFNSPQGRKQIWFVFKDHVATVHYYRGIKSKMFRGK
jgi:hypothetical protein